MKIPFVTALAVAASLSATAVASTILFDFNTVNGSGGPGGIWNVYAAPSNLNSGAFLLDSTGATTPLKISVSGTITDSSNAGDAAIFNHLTPDSLPAWATSSTDNTASGDYFFTSTSTAADSFTLTITGLTAGDTLSLDLLASRNDTAMPGALYEYSLNGGASWLGFSVLNSDGSLALTDGWDTFNTQTKAFNNEGQGYNLHRYMNVNGITATGSTVQLRVTDSNLNDATITNSYAVLNAVQLTIVPEPATVGLLSLGLGLGALIRRRSSRRR